MMFRFPSVICTRCTGFFCLAIIKGPPNDIYCIIEEPYKHYFTEKVSYSPGCLLLIKISYWIFSAIMGLFAICSRSGVMGIITAVFAGISTALSWLWVKFCMLFLMWSMRQNEYLADEFAYKIGFGLELATVLDQHISDVPHDGFLSAIYSTHPCNDDRVAALQNLGVPYSRY